MADRVVLHVMIDGELAKRLREYVDREWGGQRGAFKLVTAKALMTFLDAEDEKKDGKHDKHKHDT